MYFELREVLFVQFFLYSKCYDGSQLLNSLSDCSVFALVIYYERFVDMS
jgi:hypothetical protein